MSPLIVTFVNAGYISIARNWLAAMGRLGLDEAVLLVTLDDEAKAALANQKCQVFHRPLPSADLRDLWVHRVRIIAELMAEGHDIIHSDADAVWLHDARSAIADGGHDLVFSQGTVWPPDSHDKRGFVLCCGLFYLRNSSIVRDFVSRLTQRVRLVRDDQIAVNHLVDEEFSNWIIEDPYWVGFRNTTFVCSRTMMRAQGGDLSLAVVPHHACPRLMQGTDGVLVGHPLSGKTRAETESVLRDHGLWFLE